MAGSLYLLTKLPNLDSDWFVTQNDGTFLTILYDDREIITLTPQDALSNNMTLDDLSNAYIIKLKTWADSIKAKKPQFRSI